MNESSDPDARTDRVYAPDAALRLLYDTNAPILLSYVLRLTRGDWQRAEDIVQETLMRCDWP